VNFFEGSLSPLKTANNRGLFMENFKIASNGSTTTSFYMTKDPDGNTVSYSIADLVEGRGYVKSKSGVKFKPKKHIPKSILSILKNKK
jgi:hypothetical protein